MELARYVFFNEYALYVVWGECPRRLERVLDDEGRLQPYPGLQRGHTVL